MTAAARAPRRSSRRARSRSIAALVGAALLAVSVTGLVACSGNESDATTSSTLDDSEVTQPTAPPVALFTADRADPAAPILVGVGQQFAIALEAAPATGYSWQPVAVADPTILLTIGTEFRGPGEAYPGAPETQILRYVGRALGTARIALHYSRPAAAAPDDKTITFTVDVVQDPNATTTTVPPTDTSSTDTTSTTSAPRTTTTRSRSTTTTTRPRSTTTTRAKATTTTT